MITQSHAPKYLTVFKLIMMCVVAIDSLKNLPINAQYGSSILIYYLIAIITFFIPSALVTAELATCLPKTGGVYIWVREAFGKRIGFLIIWIQWMIAIIWYPTILSFIAATLFYLINPALTHNKISIQLTIIIIFWLATYGISKGIKISSQISTICALFGVLIPMGLISLLGIYWIYAGNDIQIQFIPDQELFNYDKIRLFITVLYSLMGMDMIAIHAGDVKNPQREYPLSLFISAFIILGTMIPASLAIAIVIPHEKIEIMTGVVEAFTIFLNSFHLSWMKPLIIICIATGSFGIFYTWLLNTTRCFYVAAQDGCLPKLLQKSNKNNMSIAQLIIQGILFSILSTVFIFMPSVNLAFWFLTAACAQLALMYYILIFASALYLRYKMPGLPRPFKVGKHPLVLWIVCGIPIITCFVSIVFGFFPPLDLNPKGIMTYEFLLITLIIISCCSGLLIFKRSMVIQP